jgi:hypothetical protein
MERFGQRRGSNHRWGLSWNDVWDLVPTDIQSCGPGGADYLFRHLEFLWDCKYIEPIDKKNKSGRVHTTTHLSLTTRGQAFVQPELSGFLPTTSAMPDLMKFLETQIRQSSANLTEQQSWLFKLRDAAVNKAPEFFAAVLAETIKKFITG